MVKMGLWERNTGRLRGGPYWAVGVSSSVAIYCSALGAGAELGREDRGQFTTYGMAEAHRDWTSLPINLYIENIHDGNLKGQNVEMMAF
jgi:hypothetical protein